MTMAFEISFIILLVVSFVFLFITLVICSDLSKRLDKLENYTHHLTDEIMELREKLLFRSV